MIKEVQKKGIDVYADIVLNHKIGADETEYIQDFQIPFTPSVKFIFNFRVFKINICPHQIIIITVFIIYRLILYDLYDLGEFNQKGSVPTKYGTKKEYIEMIKEVQKKGKIPFKILHH